MKTFLPLALTLLAVAANAAPAAQGGPLFGPPTTSSTTETPISGISNPVPPSPVRDVRSAQFPQPSNVDSPVGATTPPSSPIHGNRPISPPFSQSEDDSESRAVRETADSSISELSSNDSDSSVRFSSQVHNPPESPLSFGSAGFNSRPVRQVPTTTTEKNVQPVRQVPTTTTTEKNVRPVRQVTSSTTVKTTTN